MLTGVFAGSDVQTLAAQADYSLFLWLRIGTGFGSAWLATIWWSVASQRLSVSVCGLLIFALLYSFAWYGQWPSPAQFAACVLFTLGILVSIKAHA